MRTTNPSPFNNTQPNFFLLVIHKANKPVSDYSDYSDYYTGGAKGSDNYSDELEDYLEDYGYDYDFDDGLMSGKVKVRVKRDFGVSGEKSYDDLVYFMLFNSIWTIVVALPYLALVPVFFAHLSNIFVTVGVEAVTCIFWFAGFIGLAATLPEAQMCDFVPDYCRIVRMSQAATVFGAFEWYVTA